MYAISTVGSLLGTFLSALLLIPLVGTQRTFLVFALALAVVATLGLGRRWALVPLGVAALLALPIGTVKAAGEGRVIHETDTEYQYARVIDHADGERTLELNEGQAIHSLYRPETVLTDGYWDGFLVAPFAVRREPPRRVAMLGFAGGTVARAYARYFPRRAHRRRGDRQRAVRHRPPLLRPAPAAAAARVRRGRAAVPAPHRRPLRRHLPRHLPPALHPVLPLDARVLRARARPPRPRRLGRGQPRPPGGLGRAREGAVGDDGHGAHGTSRATRSSRPTRS